MALALYSLATAGPVRTGIAMTGELTLTGKVLPIGGVKEKTIAARRVGVFELIFPRENKKDFDDLPEHVREGIRAHFVDYFEDVLDVVYGEGKWTAGRKDKPEENQDPDRKNLRASELTPHREGW